MKTAFLKRGLPSLRSLGGISKRSNIGTPSSREELDILKSVSPAIRPATQVLPSMLKVASIFNFTRSYFLPNDGAQARREKGVRLATRAVSRRCLKAAWLGVAVFVS